VWRAQILKGGNGKRVFTTTDTRGFGVCVRGGKPRPPLVKKEDTNLRTDDPGGGEKTSRGLVGKIPAFTYDRKWLWLTKWNGKLGSTGKTGGG